MTFALHLFALLPLPVLSFPSHEILWPIEAEARHTSQCLFRLRSEEADVLSMAASTQSSIG